jgi:signal transduction histidine kinase/ActR/RegA family two-component response regulator
MQDNENITLREELEALKEEHRKLALDHKKMARSLALAQSQIKRQRESAEAKDRLSQTISEKRSELERYMNLLLSSCPDMILLFDEDRRIAYCTDSFLRACRLPSIGVIRGKTCVELFTPYTAPAFHQAMHELCNRVYDQQETLGFSEAMNFSRTGAPRNYNVQVTPLLGEDGKVEGAIAIMTDTTDILKAQREAERANAAKSDFLAVVSHEIRTPMNAIIGLAGMLKSSGLDDQQHEYLRNIQNSSRVLLNLINDILDFSRIEAGKLDIVEGYFSLNALLRHLRSMFQPMFQQKGLEFACDFAPDLPEVVYCDDKRVSQVLTNILNNALKYTKEGGVTFSADRLEGGEVRFTVKDTGVGIRAEELPRIFSAFERVDAVHNKGVVGTGLGLAITKRLCDLMGGSIDVQSVYGEGSLFTIVFSLRTGTTADLPAEERQQEIAFVAPEARALLVDDIEINLQIATYMLAFYDLTIECADNGRDAIDKMANGNYDIVFMDHMMPEMDGVEATRLIRALGGEAACVPIVALTANAVSGAVDMFFANGFNDFLSKPIDDDALAQCLLKWLPEDKVIMVNEEA